MKIAVLGGTGTIGTMIVAALREAGHEALPLSRGSGVDAVTGLGLVPAFEGCDAVVDCLDRTTMSATKAREFFESTATNVAAAARQVGVRRVVVVSIAGAADPAVNARHGYYQGKAAQEAAYRASGVPITLIHSTQWYELVGTMVAMAGLGPLAVLPTMRMAPLAAESSARFVAEAAVDAVERTESLPLQETRAVRGPEEGTAASFARRIMAVRGEVGGKRPRWLVEAPLLGKGVAGGGLIPGEAHVDPVSVEEWAARR